jgi:hypothetical protein
MTEEKDVLIALNGVAQDVAGVINDQLVAGLWKTGLIEDMCWVYHDADQDGSHPCGIPCRPSKWRAPTWSWASIRHSVRPSSLSPRAMTDMATIVSLSVNQKSSGELGHASIQLSCRLLLVPWSAWLRKYSPIEYQPYSILLTLDDNCDTNRQRTKDSSSINAIILRQRYPLDVGLSEGILVAPHVYQDKCFERIGYFCQDGPMSASELERLNEGYDKAQESIIELV